MSNFLKKIESLGDLLKQFNASIKQPKMAGVKPPKTSAPKLPGMPSQNHKDPVKVAQQIKDAGSGAKPIAMEAANQIKESYKTSKNGQWSISKAEVKKPEAPKIADAYHIHVNGERITDKPLTRQQIIKRYGSVQRLESSGHLLVPHKD
jgi:hypothetical protein